MRHTFYMFYFTFLYTYISDYLITIKYRKQAIRFSRYVIKITSNMYSFTTSFLTSMNLENNIEQKSIQKRVCTI